MKIRKNATRSIKIVTKCASNFMYLCSNTTLGNLGVLEIFGKEITFRNGTSFLSLKGRRVLSFTPYKHRSCASTFLCNFAANGFFVVFFFRFIKHSLVSGKYLPLFC